MKEYTPKYTAQRDARHVVPLLAKLTGATEENLWRLVESVPFRDWGFRVDQVANVIGVDAQRKLHELCVVHEFLNYRESITSPDNLAACFDFGDNTQEELHVAMIDARMSVVKVAVVFRGTIDTIKINNGDILRQVLLAGVPMFAIAHNHPSGNPDPSPEDVMVTRKLKEAAELVGLTLVDSLVFGSEGRFVSMKSYQLGF